MSDTRQGSNTNNVEHMETKHTPGPWIVDDKHIHAAGYVYTTALVDDDLVVEVNTDTRAGGLLTDTDRANLALIAMAPELLAIAIECERLLADFDQAADEDNDGWKEERTALETLRKLIAKATQG